VLLNKCIARSLLTLFSPHNSSVTNRENAGIMQGVAVYLSRHLPEKDTHIIQGVTTPRRACSWRDWRHPERAEGEGKRGELSLAIYDAQVAAAGIYVYVWVGGVGGWVGGWVGGGLRCPIGCGRCVCLCVCICVLVYACAYMHT
jgi:hypothetical protein